MSGFLLCWHRAGGPVPDAIASLAAAHRAPGSSVPPRSLRRGDVIAWHWPGGWAPGAEDALPLERGGWTGSGVLRLDDRVALAARLRDRGHADRGAGVPTDAPATALADDASLAWDAFAAWGDDAPARWIGDYALAVVSAARDRMIVSRGLTGVRSCFHRALGEVECASDDLALLVALGGGPAEPVREAVAEYLRFGQVVTPTLTFHRGIRRVPAAHTLVIDRAGDTRLRRHWSLPAPAIVHGRRDDEVAEAFREVLGAAVRDRLRAPRASLLLSGGLDSSALAVEAAGTGASVQAVTVSWDRLIADDEARFAAMTAAATRLPHEVLRHPPDAGFVATPPYATPEPAPDVESRVWRAQAARLATHGPVALNGEDVDALLAAPTLIDQVRVEGLTRTLRAWASFVRATGRRPWVGLAETLRPGTHARHRAPAPPDWLRAPLAHVGAARSDVDVAHPTRTRADWAIAQPLWEAIEWLDDPVMSGSDVVVLLPYMDPRVIGFCLALPAVPWTQRKHLLRRAYAGRLPDEVLRRPKTPLAGYYEARVAAWRATGPSVALPDPVREWVDPAAWERALRAADADAVFAAWRVLELARWLSQPTGR